ncbi:hypothetical protein BH09BAC1_BH09BAC1_18100 [soil metagenome]
MPKQVYILLIVMLGVFMTPVLSYACGTGSVKTEKSCCKKGTSQSVKMDCCETKQAHKDNSDEGCHGDCKNPYCNCPALNFSTTLSYISDSNGNISFFERQSIYHEETSTSSGFHSIWIPPKIG